MKRIVLGILLVLSLAAPVVAQDATPELTLTPEPTIVVTEPAPAPDPVPPVDDGFNIVEFLTGAVVGAVTALATVFGIVGRFKNDTALLNAIEGLAGSIPADVLLQLNELGRNLRDAGEVLDKVSDKLPNTPA